jgi:hypothetical protein
MQEVKKDNIRIQEHIYGKKYSEYLLLQQGHD